MKGEVEKMNCTLEMLKSRQSELLDIIGWDSMFEAKTSCKLCLSIFRSSRL